MKYISLVKTSNKRRKKEQKIGKGNEKVWRGEERRGEERRGEERRGEERRGWEDNRREEDKRGEEIKRVRRERRYNRTAR